MPEPQPGTSKAVVLPGVSTDRFGIEGHSLLAAGMLVKTRSRYLHAPLAAPPSRVPPARRASSSSTAAGSRPLAASST